MGTVAGFDERARALLDLERDWRAHQGDKASAIRSRFAITPARYYQLIARVIDDPAASAYDPLTVRRLRRRRDERRRRQSGRALRQQR